MKTIIEKVNEAKLTTDLLNLAFEVTFNLTNVNNFDELAANEADRRYLARNIEGQLESGAHVGQARNELKGAQMALGYTYEEAKKAAVKRYTRKAFGLA